MDRNFDTIMYAVTRRAVGSERGTSLIEFALLIPLLLLLLLGIIEIGRYADASIVVANAARAGSQYGAQNLGTAADQSGITLAAQQDAGDTSLLLEEPNLSGHVTNTNVCGCVGSAPNQATCSALPSCGGGPMLVYVQVIASGDFKTLFPYPGIPAFPAISSTSRVRVAQ
jgi:hypothetical protein